MRPIYVDALSLLPAKMSGVGHYVANVVEGLERLGATYALVVPKGKSHLLSNKYPHATIKELPYRHKVMKLLDLIGVCPKIDKIVGYGDYFFGSFENWPLSQESRSVTCFHDVAFLRLPETIESKNLLYLRLFYRKWIRRTNVVATVSDFSRSEMQMLVKMKKDIVIVPNAVDSKLMQKMSKNGAMKILRRYGIEETNYFLHVGNMEPRKNISTVLRYYLTKSRRWLENNKFMIIGGGGWKNDEILRLIDEVNEKQPNTILRPDGYVVDEDLPAFYQLARACIMPSLYEGYGVPLMEAVLCGAKVGISPALALKEAVSSMALRSVDGEHLGAHLTYYEPTRNSRNTIPQPEDAARSLVSAFVKEGV